MPLSTGLDLAIMQGWRSGPCKKKKIGDAQGIRCLFLDIGGVLLSNGWDHAARKRAMAHFELDPREVEVRHHLVIECYEEGKLTFERYLDQVVFFRKRSFTRAQFKAVMREQSTARPGMIDLFQDLKRKHRLKVVVVSNEGRELNAYRIRKFELTRLADFFVSSCFLGIRKPDVRMFRLALDLSQVEPARVLYVENTAMFTEVAGDLGIRSILHKNLHSTREKLASFRFATGWSAIHDSA